jgi:hypothetical protein
VARLLRVLAGRGNPSGSTGCAKFSVSMVGLVDVRWFVGVGFLVTLD